MTGNRRQQKNGVQKKVIAKTINSPLSSPQSPGRRHCHVCRSPKDVTKIVACASGKRSHIFCSSCIERRLMTTFAAVLSNPNWICPKCKDCCPCSKCRKRAALNEQHQQPCGCAPMRETQVITTTHTPSIEEEKDAALTLLAFKHSPKLNWPEFNSTGVLSPSTSSESGHSFSPLAVPVMPALSPSPSPPASPTPFGAFSRRHSTPSSHSKCSDISTPPTPTQDTSALLASLAIHNHGSPLSINSDGRSPDHNVQPFALSPSALAVSATSNESFRSFSSIVNNHDLTAHPNAGASAKGSLRVYGQTRHHHHLRQQQQQQQLPVPSTTQQFIAPRRQRNSATLPAKSSLYDD
eukprot:c15339_g1_i1.p1 GENE.c15339_g1_i1~~c15339_g1_i1.p1  ORF type:complete len:351 (-),score=60.08 c15339_g1_i1:175-1227(-)